MDYQALKEAGWVELDMEKYEHIIRAIMNMVRSEIDREYWNANQKEMENPFENTGAPDFTTPYLTVRAYNWDDDAPQLPNFDTDVLKVFWYKHSNRGVMAMAKNVHDIDHLLVHVLNKSIASINESFQK